MNSDAFKKALQAQIDKGKPAKSDQKYVKGAAAKAQHDADYKARQQAEEKALQERLERKRKAEEDEAERARVVAEKRRRLAEESRQRREEEEEAAERKRRKKLGLPELPPKSSEDAEKGAVKVVEAPKRIYPGVIPTTLEPVPGGEMLVGLPISKDGEKKEFLFRQLASYFNMVLREWDDAMNKRSDSVKASKDGKNAYNIMLTARDGLEPLFRKMEAGDMEDDILKPIVEIVHAAQQRRYVDANDGYLRLSIGNAYVPRSTSGKTQVLTEIGRAHV